MSSYDKNESKGYGCMAMMIIWIIVVVIIISEYNLCHFKNTCIENNSIIIIARNYSVTALSTHTCRQRYRIMNKCFLGNVFMENELNTDINCTFSTRVYKNKNLAFLEIQNNYIMGHNYSAYNSNNKCTMNKNLHPTFETIKFASIIVFGPIAVYIIIGILLFWCMGMISMCFLPCTDKKNQEEFNSV